jgi:D-aminopeptidase
MSIRNRFPLIVGTCLALAVGAGVPAAAKLPFHFGFWASGPLDAITDVAGVRVANLTLIQGSDIRTGATAILPNGDPWVHKTAGATLAFNGNGEMTGTHWIDESGYLEEPIVLTNTLNVWRAGDGVVDWMIEHHPEIGISDDVPLPVVAECDDQLLNDIQKRAVSASDVRKLLDDAQPGQFARGNVGAGTGMKAFGFKAGIGTASRVLPASLGGYTVGVLVNDNTGSSRQALTIVGVPVGERLKDEYKPVYPQHLSEADLHGRMQSGSIIIVVATDAPLDSRQLQAILKRAALGMGRTGLTSDTGSGDLFIAFSTSIVFERTGNFDIAAPTRQFTENDRTINALYSATAEATQAAIYDALFEAKTMTGRGGATMYGLPVDRVLEMLRSAGAISQ